LEEEDPEIKAYNLGLSHAFSSMSVKLTPIIEPSEVPKTVTQKEKSSL
jgi:hypothetical protein